MKRRDFLKLLGLGAGAAATVGMAKVEIKPEKKKPKSKEDCYKPSAAKLKEVIAVRLPESDVIEVEMDNAATSSMNDTITVVGAAGNINGTYKLYGVDPGINEMTGVTRYMKGDKGIGTINASNVFGDKHSMSKEGMDGFYTDKERIGNIAMWDFVAPKLLKVYGPNLDYHPGDEFEINGMRYMVEAVRA